MAFEDDEDQSTKFVILRKDNMELTGPIRRLNTSIHEYNEVSYCFGMFRKIKKTKKQENSEHIDALVDNQFYYKSTNQQSDTQIAAADLTHQKQMVRQVSKLNKANRSLDVTGQFSSNKRKKIKQ